MTTEEFNEKYKIYLEEGHYGLAIDNPEVIVFLDDIFKDLTKIPGFTYSQIKMKFGQSRFYSNIKSDLGLVLEREINRIIYDKLK